MGRGWVTPSIDDEGRLNLNPLFVGFSNVGPVVRSTTSLIVTPHALGRLWQRTTMDGLEWERVRRTLFLPLHFAPATQLAYTTANSLAGYKCFPLPCHSGMLVAVPFSTDGIPSNVPLAVTYLEPPLSPKWELARRTINGLLLKFHDWEPALAMGVNMQPVFDLSDAIADSFSDSRFAWMREERPDVNR